VPYAGTRGKSISLISGKGLRELDRAPLVDVAELQNATRNFTDLQQILRLVMNANLTNDDGPKISPTIGLRRLTELPNRAEDPQGAPKPAKKQRRPRSSRA